ncbi:MAG: hypothetical protein B6D62_03245 [Candidatus Cloacimonas sp. 4484_275]|nr:MAG: hypothetical protein B6D62_03245 [Candidatus Cloacimonas sp. 4484_275]
MVARIILSLTLISFVFYLYYLRIFYLGLKAKKQHFSPFRKRVSVVVAARNEEENISRLLTSLVNQEYPPELFEIIIADDDSEDETADLVMKFAEKWDNIKLIKVKNREQALSPKKNALAQAIEKASGEIIMTTDADCIVGKYWIKSTVAAFDDKTAMVSGFSRTNIGNWKTAKNVKKFEHFDFLVMFFAAAGAISKGKYFSCSGQNLAYKKSAFEKVGGFEPIKHLISGDDVNLMQLMRRQKMKISFNFSPHSFVITRAIGSWKELFNQRSRWASNSKWQILLNPEFFVYLVFVFIATLFPFVLLFFNWKIGLLLIFAKYISDFYFVRLGFRIFGLERERLKYFPFWFFLQPPYIILVTLMGIFDIFKWRTGKEKS